MSVLFVCIYSVYSSSFISATSSTKRSWVFMKIMAKISTTVKVMGAAMISHLASVSIKPKRPKPVATTSKLIITPMKLPAPRSLYMFSVLSFALLPVMNAVSFPINANTDKARKSTKSTTNTISTENAPLKGKCEFCSALNFLYNITKNKGLQYRKIRNILNLPKGMQHIIDKRQ